VNAPQTVVMYDEGGVELIVNKVMSDEGREVAVRRHSSDDTRLLSNGCVTGRWRLVASSTSQQQRFYGAMERDS
jgi:hypothetical protein